jgi:hypothetical protein
MLRGSHEVEKIGDSLAQHGNMLAHQAAGLGRIVADNRIQHRFVLDLRGRHAAGLEGDRPAVGSGLQGQTPQFILQHPIVARISDRVVESDIGIVERVGITALRGFTAGHMRLLQHRALCVRDTLGRLHAGESFEFGDNAQRVEQISHRHLSYLKALPPTGDDKSARR